MFDVYLLVDIIVVSSLLLLGVVSLLKDRAAVLNRNFMLFVVCVSVWIIANYISNDIKRSAEIARIANYFVFSFSYLATIFMLRFTVVLTNDKNALKMMKSITWPLIAIATVAASPLVVKGVHVQGKVYAVEFGPLIVVYAAALLFTLGYNVFLLARNVRAKNGVNRARSRVLFISLILSLPLLIIAQFILPTVTGWFGFTNIGVLAMLGIVYGLYYSVAKHRLFDLRPVIVRSLAYVVTLVVLTIFYTYLSYRASSLIVVQHNNILHFLVNASLILIVILGYQPLKNLFKKLTNKVFYQDMYDSEFLYTELNKVLVSTIDLDELLTRVSRLITGTLNIQYCLFFLHSDTKSRFVSDSRVEHGPELINYLPKKLIMAKSRIVIIDQLSSSDAGLGAFMSKYNISSVVKLNLTVHSKGDGMDCVLLGPKNTGYAYNNQDRTTLEVIANELTIAMQNALHFEEIENFNATLQQQVEEQTRKYRAANERLKKLDETKDEFISMASHQLRTPLTSIKGYLSMVLEGDAGKLNEQQEQMLQQSFLSSERMVNLIADLLNLSRLNTGKFVIDATPTDLRMIVDQEVSQLRETAKAKNIELTYEMPPTFTMINLDENKIHQVVMNFIDNALYYTPPGGKVTVALIETPTAIEYRVTDTGIGVPRDLQHHLFSKFYRADNARRMRPDGTGLGLYMAKKIVVAQGGSIIFKSIENVGSTFGFRFVKAHVGAMPTTVADDSTETAKR